MSREPVRRHTVIGVCSLMVILLCSFRSPQQVHAEEDLFQVTALTDRGSFTPGIEGPACDRDGFLYAVNFQQQQTIGRVSPQGVAEVWLTLPGDSVGNGLRFDRQGMLYVADYVGHNVLKIDPATRTVTVHAHQPRMNQPNDLTISADGTLFASDPNWNQSTGQVWRIDRDGSTHLVAQDMGTTNGIDLSPDGRTLYVNESVQRNVWGFTVTPDGQLIDKRLLKQFPDHGFDGMRCDVDGNLYITRYGKGTVAILSPGGQILEEVRLSGMRPSNLCFGGPDGRTVYVTEVENQQVLQFRTQRPGLEWRLNQPD